MEIVDGIRQTTRSEASDDLALVEEALLVDLHPGLLPGWIVGTQSAGQVPQVLASVIQIDDLHRTGKVLVGQVPDPFGAVAYDDLLLRATPAPVPGF